MNYNFADIHCHPTLKAYGNSFPPDWKINSQRPHSSNPADKNNIWHYSPPSQQDINLDKIGITQFSQSDMTSLYKGNVRLIYSSLYTLERGFFANKLGTGTISDKVDAFLTGVNNNCVNHVQTTPDYFPDLLAEYKFLCEGNKRETDISGIKSKYNLVNSAEELQQTLDDCSCFNIAVINTIEGSHSLGCGMDPQNHPVTNFNEIIDRVKLIKNWKYPPFFITMSHHFYNELCGHEESLDKISFAVDQSFGMKKNFNQHGFDVLNALLDKKSGKRVLIDIKHLSKYTSRQDFYNFIKLPGCSSENIPIIVSHGAVTGSSSDKIPFNKGDINFSDDELITIAKSNGIFGIMFDQGRLASKFKMTVLMKFAGPKMWSNLIWLQIAHIAEVLDKEGLPAWNLQTLGTDFDGVINPINGFYTAEDLPLFKAHLLEHAKKYMSSRGKSLRQSFNKIDAEEIVYRFMWKNAHDFAVNNL